MVDSESRALGRGHEAQGQCGSGEAEERAEGEAGDLGVPISRD